VGTSGATSIRGSQRWHRHRRDPSSSSASFSRFLGHWWIGLIIAPIGLVFFGGFAKGKRYRSGPTSRGPVENSDNFRP
jgi:hypothetical protein